MAAAGVGVMMLSLVGCATAVPQAVAVLYPTQGQSARGVVTFWQEKGGVRIVAEVTGLKANAKHAIHVHQFGDARDAHAKSAGGHYNPSGAKHGRPEAAERHAGDLGNLLADSQGNAHYERIDHRVSIAGFRNRILGRSVIVHAGEDQFTGASGNAGPRIAIGVIGIARPSQ